ncbi:MAG: class I SAM-dependent methyltransferase [Chlamydiae bacterium]|nr:class I SAM-dependent methyltransferase [Chlamydiota bacterium]
MSWEEVAHSYDKIVGKEGHYYHTHVIMPSLLKLFQFDKHQNPKLLDLGCGQGFLQEHIPSSVRYTGVDASKSLINLAKKRREGSFEVHDLTKPLSLKEKDFTHITLILSLQNMGPPDVVLKSAKEHLAKDGSIFIVLNHPCFRVPRQTSWGIDEAKKIQFRRIDRYLTPLIIPIAMAPSKKEESEVTSSYHYPISTYINILGDLSLGVTHMEEWISDKQSSGKFAKMENRSREEIPLFLLLQARH